MKYIPLILGILLSISIIACKKDKTITPIVKTKLELLTSQTWKYQEYYRDYSGGTGTLVYKRGSSSNSFNLDQNRVTFYSNGSYSELNESGTVFAGTWKFLNSETQVQVDNITGTYVSTIETLTATDYSWSTSGGILGKMIPQ